MDRPKAFYLFLCLFLASVTLIAFWQLNNCDFVKFDDHEYVKENKHIQNGITIEGIKWAFTTSYAANWHPLTWVSHMLDIQLFGLEPRWHHLTNLLFHIANTLLLFFVLHRMTRAPWQSACVAALFAIHPLHVESVAWVAERKDVLSTFFWMLTMAAYSYYVEHPRLKNYLAVLAFFALGLMAKPMLVTLPFVLLLMDFWPLRRIDRWAAIRPLLLEKIPLLALTALSCIITFTAQARGGAVISAETLSPGLRISNALVSYIAYIGKMIWPSNLAIYYPHPGSWPFWYVSGAVLIMTAVTSLVIWKAKRFPYLASGWLWYAGTLVPVIGIVQVGRQAMADRYTYVPLIGLFIMAAWGISELLKNRRYRKEVLSASSALVLSCLFIATWIQVGYWRSSITLFDHTLEVTDRNFVILIARGAVYTGLGNQTRAIEDFDRAIEINPGFADAYNCRGAAYDSLGNHYRAIRDFDRAIEINPRFAAAYFNRGIAYNGDENQAGAIEDFNRAIQINPEYAKAYYFRGMVHGILENHERAYEDLKTAARFGYEDAKEFLRSEGMNW